MKSLWEYAPGLPSTRPAWTIATNLLAVITRVSYKNTITCVLLSFVGYAAIRFEEDFNGYSRVGKVSVLKESFCTQASIAPFHFSLGSFCGHFWAS